MGSAPSVVGKQLGHEKQVPNWTVAKGSGDQVLAKKQIERSASSSRNLKYRKVRKQRRGAESSGSDSDGSESSLSSLSVLEPEKGADEVEPGLLKLANAVPKRSKVPPQRRCHFIEVPLGTSGILKKRVFEVRERAVEKCPQNEEVVPLKPTLSHATTDTIIVRWELSNWSDVKKVSHHELQWTQPSLEQNKYLQVYSFEYKDRPKPLTEDFGQNDEPKDSAGQEEGHLEQVTEMKPVEIFCDRDFCTLPSDVIRQIDLRAEVRIKGLPGGCPPLLFRARTKLGFKGWGSFCEVSDEMSTLPRICHEVTPFSISTSAHSLCLTWGSPSEKVYGKVTTFTLFGAMVNKFETLGNEQQQISCDKLLKSLKTAYADGKTEEFSTQVAKENAITWVKLYEGTGQEFSIGTRGYISSEVDAHVARELMRPTLSLLEDYFPNSQTMQNEGFLPHDWPFLFRVEVSSGSWFHGEYFQNNFESPITCIWTSLPTIDRPSPPQVMSYHGMTLARSITLHFCPPKEYGNGHDAATYRAFFPFSDSTSWFGVDVRSVAQSIANKRKLKSLSKTWKMEKKIKDDARIAQEENLQAEGWDHRIDPPSCRIMWENSLSGEKTCENPEDEFIPVYEYILFMRVDTQESIQKFKECYRGPLRHVTIQNLRPCTYYEFALKIIDRRAGGLESEQSAPIRASTAPIATEKLTLPLGWVELWDSVTDFVYYHHRTQGQIQWEHPCGSGIDDPDLHFRKKRFRLLHRFYERLPPAQNVETFKLHIRRAKMLEDTVETFRNLIKEDFSRRFNINFEGEDGIDSGGLTTEWYLDVSKHFFNPKNGFVQCCEASQLFTIASNDGSVTLETRRAYFVFFGQFMAKAVYDKRVLFAPFCAFIWKHLLGRQPCLDDIQQIDPQFHSSLSWILENDITDVLFEHFSVRDGDSETQYELLPGGKDIEVTEENKHDYVEKVVSWKLDHSISNDVFHLKQGFHELIPQHELDRFDSDDIQLLINGSDEISVKALRRLAKYANGFTDKSKPVQYFWNVFESVTPTLKGKIMAFVTGSTKMPLEDVTIQIVRSDEDPETLPTSHTCFNQLVIPVYESQQQLEEKLLFAVEHAHGFYMT